MEASTRQILLEAVRSLEGHVVAAAPGFDRERRLPPALVDRMAASGLLRMTMPAEYDGFAVDPQTYMDVLEKLASLDGSVGWVGAITTGTAGYIAANVAEPVARRIFHAPEVVTCGTLAIPAGKAVVASGGYRVSGRWPFGSGSLHAQWFASNTTVFEGGEPRLAANGQPERRMVVTPADDVRIFDTWHVYGLRGTGSNDYAIEDVFVPDEFTFPAVGPPLHPGRFHQNRTFLLAHPAHALGIARRCLDAYRDLVGAKSAPFSPEPLAQIPATQSTLARAEALVGSARAYVAAVTGDFWETLSGGGTPSPDQCARVRMAMTTGVTNSLEAVRMVYQAAGTTGIYEGHPLERGMRDLTVAAQHAAVAARSWETAGRALLGLDQKAPYLL